MSLPATPVGPGRGRGTLRFAPYRTGPPGSHPAAEVWAYRGDMGASLSPVEAPPAGIILCTGHAAGSKAPPGIPAVSEVDEDLLREGERVAVDGGAGTLELEGVREIPVVTAFLERPDGRILLLRRSERVGSFQGRWAAVSGYFEDPTPVAQAVREIREETGIGEASLRLVAAGAPVLSRDSDRVYVVHPFRFRVDSTEVRLDWEHTEFEWVEPREIAVRPTVPKLALAWQRVRGP